MLAERGAFAEAEPLLRRFLEATERQLGPEHRWTLEAVNNLGYVLKRLGKFSEAPLMCCAVLQSPWQVDGAAFCVGKSWEKCRETINAFSDHLRVCHLCRSARMHEHDNFTQIISNHLKSCHIWKCQNMDMSKFGKRCLQRTDAALQVSV